MSDDSDLFWPADAVAPATGPQAEDAAREIRALLARPLRKGTDAAVTALGAALRPLERPQAVVAGHLDAEHRRDRERLVLVTDQRVLIADLAGDEVRSWTWREVDSFAAHRSAPVASGGLFNRSLVKPTACVYAFRLADGRRVTLANVGPKGAAHGLRITWHVRTSRLPGPLRMRRRR